MKQVSVKYCFSAFLTLIAGFSANSQNIKDTMVQRVLPDVTIMSQIARSHETPVATSTITQTVIEEKLGTQEFPEILRFTPGVHPNKQGGGWGDAEIFMRGFDNSNVAVLINGIPTNDMENYSVYWSNWMSLSDVASSIQSQRGISSSKLVVPTIGGAINIVTKNIEVQRGGRLMLMLGNDGYSKQLLSYNSGITKNGWAVSFLGSQTSGDGYIQGLEFNSKAYFINISKLINDNHQISIMSFGAPQKHYRRSNALTKTEWEKVRSQYSIGKRHWSCYNPDYGFDNNGQRKTNDYEEYNTPFISLNHVWYISNNSNLSTTLYTLLGRGISRSGTANGVIYDEYDWYGSDYGTLNTIFRNSDGTFAYNMIEDINMASSTGSQLIMTDLETNNRRHGLMSVYSCKLSDYLNLLAGIDMRYYKGRHTNKISDLFGGEYYIDPERGDVSIDNNSIADSVWVNQKLGVGDVVHRDYDAFVTQSGTFVQIEYKKHGFAFHATPSINYTTYSRYDRLYYDSEHAKSDVIGFVGGAIRCGANYSFLSHHNIYANTGFLSRPPIFKSGAFMSANTSNVINVEAKNEKAVSVEIGYGYHNEWLDLNFCGYATKWLDKSMTKKGKMTNKKQYYMNMTGVDALHVGLELEAKIIPAKWLEIAAMISIGDWRWDGESVKSYAYDLIGQPLTPEGNVTTIGADNHAWATINMSGIHVGGSAQTTGAIDITAKPFDNIKAGITYFIYDRNYAYYSLSGGSLSIGKEMYVSEPYKIPTSHFFDAHVTYSIPLRNSTLSIIGLVHNIFDKYYIEKAWNPSNVGTTLTEINENNVYYFYSFGRTWSVKLSLDF